jgi:hypothetical protein
MLKLRSAALAVLVVTPLFSSQGFAQEPTQTINMARPEGPLVTRWAKDVSQVLPLPEYPRPQMVRKNWQNLNGRWQFGIGKENEAPPAGRNLSETILVPFPMESYLSGLQKHAPRVWYRRTFNVSPKSGERVLLHFGAVDWEAKVWVNGQQIGSHTGGFTPFSFDITSALRPNASQELVVGVFDPTDKGPQPRGKQVLKPGGIFYTPVTGIWQTVWLETVPASYIENLKLTPDVDNGALRLHVNAAGAANGLKVRAVAMNKGNKVGEVVGNAGSELRLPIRNARLWTPENPHLYDLQITLMDDRKWLDRVDSYFAMRKIALGKDAKGITRPMLNGKFIFQVGPLDQGFWPDGIYTAPTDEALRYDVEITKRLGFNMTRKHVKIEPARWYYWTDKLGLLVWQDMPAGDNNTPEGKANFEHELKEMIDDFHNHPSIVMWVVFNEAWGQFDTERITNWTMGYDRSRLISNASGWTDKNVGHIIDMHKYPAPGMPQPEASRAAVLGEFGGLGLRIEGHSWVKEAWGYSGLMRDGKQLTRKFQQFMSDVYKMRDQGLSASVYTQITDVETEVNGLLTYDRAILKADAETVTKSNRGVFPPMPIITEIMPTSQKSGLEWRYTTDKPADNWMQPGFNDANWKTGQGGFGTQGTPGAVVRTTWNTPSIWMRRTFNLANLPTGLVYLNLHHDEDAEVYINGVLAARAGGYVGDYSETGITPEARAALKPGENVIALHVKQTGGGQYADVGIVSETPAK